VDVRPQRIENYDPVRPGNELRDDLLSDEPGSAGHEYAHPVTLSRRWPDRKDQLVVCPLRGDGFPLSGLTGGEYESYSRI